MDDSRSRQGGGRAHLDRTTSRKGLLPLSARNERGEGWGEGHNTAATKANRTQEGPPLPGPLLPRWEERETSRDGTGGTVEMRPWGDDSPNNVLPRSAYP